MKERLNVDRNQSLICYQRTLLSPNSWLHLLKCSSLLSVNLLLVTLLSVTVILLSTATGQTKSNSSNQLNTQSNRQQRSQASSTSDLQQKQIAALIEQLGDENFQKRRAAEISLMRIGLPAFEQLRQARNHPIVQIDRAASYILDSQSVNWLLDTDPHGVKQILQDYNEHTPEERQTRMQQLAIQKSSQATMALCRLTRYENSEKLSKWAAISLIESLVERFDPHELADLTPYIREEIGDSRRVGVDWLVAFIDSIDDGVPNSDRLRDLSKVEYLQLQKESRDTSRELVTRLYRVTASYLIQHSEKDGALETVRACLDLVDGKHVRSTAMWAIDAGLPEIVNDLAERHKELFATEPQLGFLLAESFLANDNKAQAEILAERASGIIVREDSLRQGLNLSPDELVATQRKELATYLEGRGMFGWARQEYQKALAGDLRPEIEMRVRHGLSHLLSDGEAYADAAEILRVYLEKLQDNPVALDKAARSKHLEEADNDLDYLKGTYNYLSGLAAQKDKNTDAARSFFLLALKFYPENVDILIALRGVVESGKNDEAFQSAMKKQIGGFHEEIASLERGMMAVDRNRRDMEEQKLAMVCNQLAWLLSKTQQNPDEAVHLSERSLALLPDYGIYQDTLARCYFSAGHVDKAISMQELALKKFPHERSMLRQLDEFKAAKAKSN